MRRVTIETTAARRETDEVIVSARDHGKLCGFKLHGLKPLFRDPARAEAELEDFA